MKTKATTKKQHAPAIGTDDLLFTLTDMTQATGLSDTTVLNLWHRALFPHPVHFAPFLWRADDVRAWINGAAVKPPVAAIA
jgi:predicted DNA-binding transcriptional regulator AlpA